MSFRGFIILLFSFFSLKSFAQDTIQVVLNPISPGLQIPSDFAGLSFETYNLNNSTFAPSKDTLLRFFQTLGIQSVRIGGNSVDQDTFSTTASSTRFTEAEIDSFYGFINKANCKVLMGLNLGGDNNPSLADSEVSYIMKNFASNVWGFEVGNEPDLYNSNGYRSSYYWVNSYDSEYTQYYDTVRYYNPSAIFTGPVSAYAYSTFTMPFCRNMKGIFSLLTQHYYIAGAYSAPVHQQVITLLSQSQQNNILTEADALVQCADSIPLPFRMDECNSLYNHGQVGVSDAFVSSLWALDYMYTLASAGCAGVNFHGGLTDFVYTPIAYSNNLYEAKPIYYGILAFQAGSKGKFIPSVITNNNINLNIYSVIDSTNTIFVTVVNKDTLQNALIQLQAGSTNYTSADYITLNADSLTDTVNVSLGSQKVTSNGLCAAYNWQNLTVMSNATQVGVPAGSAAIIRFKETTTFIDNLSELQPGFQVFPNPAASSIYLITQEIPATPASIEVFDVTGRKVYSCNLTEKETIVNISNFIEGIYLLKVNGNDKEYYQTSFVKE